MATKRWTKEEIELLKQRSAMSRNGEYVEPVKQRRPGRNSSELVVSLHAVKVGGRSIKNGVVIPLRHEDGRTVELRIKSRRYR